MKTKYKIFIVLLLLSSCRGNYVLVDQYGNKYRQHMRASLTLDGSK